MEMTAGSIELEFSDPQDADAVEFGVETVIPESVVAAAIATQNNKSGASDLILRGRVNAAVKQAKGLVIKTAEDCQKAQIVLKDCKKLQKEIKESFSESVDKSKKAKAAATEAYKSVCDHLDSFIGPLKDIESSLKGSVDSWTANMERLRQIEERKKADEAAKLQEAAQKAMEKGDAEKAVELSTQAAMTTASAPAVQTAKVEGIYTQTRWTFEVVDAAKIPREYLLVDEAKLSALATANHDTVKVPGVRFYTKTTTAVRA